VEDCRGVSSALFDAKSAFFRPGETRWIVSDIRLIRVIRDIRVIRVIRILLQVLDI
jgi:hypothetical protein